MPSDEDSDYTVADDGLILLESDKCLSELIIWDFVHQSYEEDGPSAFKIIPYWVTNNAGFVSAIADLVLAFLLDCDNAIDVNQPLQIVELGAGTGCFGYRLLAALMQKIRWFDKLRDIKLNYLMTDYASTNVDAWKSNIVLQKLIDEGLMSVRNLNIETDIDKSLVTTPNPLIVLATSVIRWLKRDKFCVQNGRLLEYLYSTIKRVKVQTNDTDNANNVVETGKLEWTNRIVEVGSDRFLNERYQKVLDTYRDGTDCNFSFPIGTFKLLDDLRNSTQDNFVFIGTDYGTEFDFPQEIESPNEISVNVPANFDAIRKYVQLSGGDFELAEIGDLQLFVISMLANRDKRLERTLYELYGRIAHDQPSLVHDAARRLIKLGIPETSRFKLFVSSMCVCKYDPEIFLLFVSRFLDALERDADKLSPFWIDQVNDVIGKVLHNVYSMSGNQMSYELTKDPLQNIINVWQVCKASNFERSGRSAIMLNLWSSDK
jgi:hypothetical protein